MTPYEIPLTPEAQSFHITLGGIDYSLRLLWNAPDSVWLLDLNDTNGTPILQGIPLVTGVDLLAQFAYLGLGGQLVAQTDNAPDAVPTVDNLGVTGRLYFVVTP